MSPSTSLHPSWYEVLVRPSLGKRVNSLSQSLSRREIVEGFRHLVADPTSLKFVTSWQIVIMWHTLSTFFPHGNWYLRQLHALWNRLCEFKPKVEILVFRYVLYFFEVLSSYFFRGSYVQLHSEKLTSGQTQHFSLPLADFPSCSPSKYVVVESRSRTQ